MLHLESEVQWFNTRVTEIFCFHKIKSLMPILALLPFLCISKKTLLFVQIFTVNGRTVNLQNRVANNGMVHTVTTFITSPSWTSCGRYIELSLILEVLEDLLIGVDRLDVLKSNLILFED